LSFWKERNSPESKLSKKLHKRMLWQSESVKPEPEPLGIALKALMKTAIGKFVMIMEPVEEIADSEIQDET